ncbi:DUF3298 domain-containing protein [Sedimentibacter sp. zth1]|uniref:DUF3298 and DUF4163 domain-containing protein n=1 Tax=Sedimentibacter sp. zth1 TaxID=2816908 RepID=UPI001A91996F|nr:DUF3298 and DUF4163 domain-containing protein [Sedimentibacter sp. zth1]QSX06870.1 DUF3298 domain-containing protein [Sedimentibacter sp. zth1]
MKNDLKLIHDNTPIPTDLNKTVEEAIKIGLAKKRGHKGVYKVITSVVACFLVFVTLINTSYAFAQTMTNVPILNKICKVFTFREYEEHDDKKIVNVKIPNISNTNNSELEKRVNYEISKIINEEVEESKIRALEYYDAFIATGGKKEDFSPIEITVDYDIKRLDENIVSFVINKYETLASAYQQFYYYNIDLESGRDLMLKDFFGTNYKNIVARQVKEKLENADESVKQLLFDDVNIEDLINDNTNFYINENKNIVIVFDKYTIAAGAAGRLEFELENN